MSHILFMNSDQPQCGVYQFGKRTYEIISQSDKYKFPYLEGTSNFRQTFDTYKPRAVLYNYHPSTMGWIKEAMQVDVPKIALYHEVPITGFDYYIHLDPTYYENNNNFTTVRPLFNYENNFPVPGVTTIGSFGFGFDNKRFDKIINQVNDEFDEAIIRLHIPYAYFGDVDGHHSRRIASELAVIPRKPGIKLEITHHFMSDRELLDFLAQNTVNCFFFDNMYGRGVSSSTDYALSVKRPIAITNNWMHRHIRNAQPTITIDNAPLKWIIDNGNKPLEPFQKLWSRENLIKDYERILDSVLQ